MAAILLMRRRLSTAVPTYGQNLVEKIVQRYAVDLPKGHVVRAGDYVYIQPKHVMTHDNTSAVMSKFTTIRAKQILNPKQTVFCLDHDVQNKSDKNLAKYKSIEEFARQQGVDFYPAGRGIGHQIMVEEGYAFPLNLTVASDSHSNMYGGVGSLGTPVVRTDAASLWATGRTWWQVPPVAKVELYNQLPPGVTGKDIIITLCGVFNKDEVLNHCVEFSGDNLEQLGIDDRLAIANMTTEWGALAGVFPVDSVTISWLKSRSRYLHKRDGKDHARVNDKTVAELDKTRFNADADAYYSKILSLDLSSVAPHVSGPNHVKVMHSVHDISKEKVKINKAYLVSCVNSRETDIEQAATVIQGRQVAPDVQFYIAAASSEVQKNAEAAGYWQILLDAGATPLPSGCGPCVGLGSGLLEDGEVGISATNRNFKGRMGSPKAQAYLASPAVVAASAVAGYIRGPTDSEDTLQPVASIVESPLPPRGDISVEVVPGFPETITGEIVFCHQDNLNTDGIYPGKYTYNEHLTPDEMAAVVMENYDPKFAKTIKHNDILVGGFNFGTGSSREQAATALKYAGVRLLLAGSYSETYKRNAVNNAFLPLEAPELVRELHRVFGSTEPTVRTGWIVTIDFKRATAVVKTLDNDENANYSVTPVGKAAQELVLAGGLEAWIKQQVAALSH